MPVEEVARIERERPVIELPADDFLARVVAGSGDCAPGPAGPYAYASCCDGSACRGQCVADENRVACSCFGDGGGCAEGEVCCKYRQGCSLPEDCQGV